MDAVMTDPAVIAASLGKRWAKGLLRLDSGEYIRPESLVALTPWTRNLAVIVGHRVSITPLGRAVAAVIREANQ